MKRYLNKSNQMAVIKFADGSAQFLFANQWIDTTKRVSSLSASIIERTSPVAPRPAPIKKEAVKQAPKEDKEEIKLDDNGDK